METQKRGRCERTRADGREKILKEFAWQRIIAVSRFLLPKEEARLGKQEIVQGDEFVGARERGSVRTDTSVCDRDLLHRPQSEKRRKEESASEAGHVFSRLLLLVLRPLPSSSIDLLSKSPP